MMLPWALLMFATLIASNLAIPSAHVPASSQSRHIPDDDLLSGLSSEQPEQHRSHRGSHRAEALVCLLNQVKEAYLERKGRNVRIYRISNPDVLEEYKNKHVDDGGTKGNMLDMTLRSLIRARRANEKVRPNEQNTGHLNPMNRILGREQKEEREPRERREPRESREPREGREPQEGRENGPERKHRLYDDGPMKPKQNRDDFDASKGPTSDLFEAPRKRPRLQKERAPPKFGPTTMDWRQREKQEKFAASHVDRQAMEPQREWGSYKNLKFKDEWAKVGVVDGKPKTARQRPMYRSAENERPRPQRGGGVGFGRTPIPLLGKKRLYEDD